MRVGAGPSPTMPYTTDSWLSRRRGHLADGTVLPDDVLAAVFVRLTDAADVLRCAATCKRWCRVVAKDAAIHARLLPPELARRRAFFGVFSQQALPDPVPGVADAAYHRKRKRVSGSSSVGHISSPCGLIPASAAAYWLFGFRSPYSIPLSNGGRHSALLEHSRPVAARTGWVVLSFLDLCVFNPMTGEIFMLPSLSGEARPRCYACALLTRDDVDEPLPTSTTVFFRVLIIYNRYRFTAFRAFSSETSRWGTEVARSAHPKIDNSVVLRGVAYWPLRHSALAVWLDGPEPCEITMPPWGIPADQPQSLRLLGQQKLCFIDVLPPAGLPCRTIFLLTSVLSTVDGQDTNMLKWVMLHGRLYIPEMMVCSSDDFKLRWFCEKSGVILFTIGEETTHKIQKVVDGTGCSSWRNCGSWRNVVGYEMDAAGYLASLWGDAMAGADAVNSVRGVELGRMRWQRSDADARERMWWPAWVDVTVAGGVELRVGRRSRAQMRGGGRSSGRAMSHVEEETHLWVVALGQLCPRTAAAATWPARGDDPGRPANPSAVMSRPPAHAPDPLYRPIAHCTSRFAMARGHAIMASRAPPLAAGAHVVQSLSAAGFPPTTRQGPLLRIFAHPRNDPPRPTPPHALFELGGASMALPAPFRLALSSSSLQTITNTLPFSFSSRSLPPSSTSGRVEQSSSSRAANRNPPTLDGNQSFSPPLGHFHRKLHLHVEPYTPVIPVAAKLHDELRLRPVNLTRLSAPRLDPRSWLSTSPEQAAPLLTVDEPCRFATVLETYPKRLAVSPSSFSPTSPASVRLASEPRDLVQGALADGTYNLIPANEEEAPEGGADVIVIDPESGAGVAQEGKPRSIT
ncbi:hypothetical protein HU200_038507 [Digitaria exilis]|uniref:F-box domain-containing protein n=1 Tax=Digitaria exilis TaxID=1010633 RepID=A0A835BCF0_9POAL|nr:hypothetical protein HU200_038507 [Digitaria exilis]